MNRNMRGERFSRAELVAMAIEIGAITEAEVTRDMKTHVFERMTRFHRLTLFAQGEAMLDTRPETAKPAARVVLDREVLEFLGVKV